MFCIFRSVGADGGRTWASGSGIVPARARGFDAVVPGLRRTRIDGLSDRLIFGGQFEFPPLLLENWRCDSVAQIQILKNFDSLLRASPY